MICDVSVGDGVSLFAHAEDLARSRLASSALGALAPDECVADLFCGAGGWGEGGKLLGIDVDFAVNHWSVAIDAHAANNPACTHHRGDAWRIRPRQVIGSAKLGLLLASAACTTHSRARGSAPVSKRVHMLGWCIARWMEEAQPRIVLIENVPEWKDWGPTIVENGLRKQDPNRKGMHFRRWWRYCERLGYQMEMRVLDAPDYGEASRRHRLFIIARRDGGPIVWPEKTHGKLGNNDSRSQSNEVPDRAADGDGRGRCGEGADSGLCGSGAYGLNERAPSGTERRGCGVSAGRSDEGVRSVQSFRTAAECIDWTDLGRSIFDRKAPLRPKTQARIAEGIRRYVIADPDAAFVLRVSQPHAPGGGWHVYPTGAPLPTQTARADLAVVSPVFTKTCQNGSNGACVGRIDAPTATMTTAQEFALAAPVLATTRNGEREGQRPRCHSVAEQMMTVTGGAVQGLALPVLQVIRGDVEGKDARHPMPTITAGNGPGKGAGAGHALAIATPVVMNNTTHHTGARADGPMPTVTTGGQGTLVSPIVTPAGGPGRVPNRTDEPLNTLLARESLAVGAACLAYLNHGNTQVGSVDVPLRTVVGGGGHAMQIVAMLMEYYGNSTSLRPANQPLGSVTTLDRHASISVELTPIVALERGRRVAAWLVEHLGPGVVPIDEETGIAYVVIGGVRRYFADILFRMLKAPELAKAMGFPDGYVWPKVQRDTVKLIGNAVSVRTARALIGSVLPGGRVKQEECAA